jgi:hypothetical protein
VSQSVNAAGAKYLKEMARPSSGKNRYRPGLFYGHAQWMSLPQPRTLACLLRWWVNTPKLSDPDYSAHHLDLKDKPTSWSLVSGRRYRCLIKQAKAYGMLTSSPIFIRTPAAI